MLQSEQLIFLVVFGAVDEPLAPCLAFYIYIQVLKMTVSV